METNRTPNNPPTPTRTTFQKPTRSVGRKHRTVMSSSMYVANVESENDQDNERKSETEQFLEDLQSKTTISCRKSVYALRRVVLEESDETPSFWQREKVWVQGFLLRCDSHIYIGMFYDGFDANISCIWCYLTPSGCFRLFDYGRVYGALCPLRKFVYFDPNCLL